MDNTSQPAKHTSGNWDTYPTFDYAFKAHHATSGVQIVSGPVGIAHLNHYQKTSDEIMANARILAAALDGLRAAKVIAFTPHIADYLLKNDPKALQQITDYIQKAEGK